MRVSGLFFSHIVSVRILRHFERLIHQTTGLIDWHFMYNPGGKHTPAVDFEYAPAEKLLNRRFQSFQRDGVLHGGYLDLVFMPCALGLDSEYVWVMEYDVDFSGNWYDFFSQFQDNPADLLTTTIFPKVDNPAWAYWPTATAPRDVPLDTYHRSFDPIMRISRRFATDYVRRMEEAGWEGHYEFTLPTSAMSGNFLVEDLGGSGPFCPAIRQGRNYANTHTNERLQPGTFLWRPSRSMYFHESADGFYQENFLYHPVKPDVVDWEDRKKDRPIEGAGIGIAVD